MRLNRRAFLAQAAALGVARGAPASYSAEMPDMLLAYMAGRLNRLATKWDQERAAIRTPEQMRARNHFVRVKVREMLGAFPEKNPLAAKTVGQLDRDGYRIEKVMFQSRPDFWVTASLYVPTSGAGPFPGIVSPCGHYDLARIYPDYQHAYVGMVKSGFVVLAFDPIGQGERRQYWNPATDQTEDGLKPTSEHSMEGQLQLLLGENLAGYRVWDGMRSIDYLLTRPEVDPRRIGCAGHSGGGTMALFMTCADERVKCAVINEGGTFHRWPVDLGPPARISPADAEQNLFPAALYGMDACDLHVAIAPRPLLVLIENYSPRFNETAGHIRARYELLGAGDKFATEEAQAPHAWTAKLRVATTDWLSRSFYGHPGPKTEPDFTPEPPAALYCTPNGSLRYSKQGESVFTLVRKQGAQLPPRRDVPAAEIRSLLRCPALKGPLNARTLETVTRDGLRFEMVEWVSEPGIYLSARIVTPEKEPAGPAILFLDEAGKDAAPAEALARLGWGVIAVDVRGAGATRPVRPSRGTAAPNPFAHLFDLEAAAVYMAWYMDASLLGMRVADVIRSVDYALGRPGAGRAVHVVGRGAGALWALYAAALDARIQSVVCHGGLLSYRTLTESDRYAHGSGIFVPGVLRHFDLPQVAAAIADRPLTLLSPVDAMKRPVEPPAVLAAYAATREAYGKAGAAGRFRVLEAASDTGLLDQYRSS